MKRLPVVHSPLKQLVIVSGKGGTGKTSVAAALAQLAGRARQVVTADCDVEAANLALVLSGDEVSSEPFMAGRRARVDPAACVGCGLCVEHCRFEALSSHAVPTVDPLGCEGCGVCALVCPEKAVTFVDIQAGRLLQQQTAIGPLIHAQLGVAQDSSGKLVAAVRRRARDIAGQEGIELVIVDGPPGIGCPVHASLTGCDLVLVVTEPTASGEHDLTRVLELVAHFRMQAMVLINKVDLAPGVAQRITTVADQLSATVVGRIPFDSAIARALAEGTLPLDMPVFAAPLEGAWRSIREVLRV